MQAEVWRDNSVAHSTGVWVFNAAVYGNRVVGTNSVICVHAQSCAVQALLTACTRAQYSEGGFHVFLCSTTTASVLVASIKDRFSLEGVIFYHGLGFVAESESAVPVHVTSSHC